MISELFSDMCVPLADDDDDDDDGGGEAAERAGAEPRVGHAAPCTRHTCTYALHVHAGAEALLASLRRHRVVCTEPPPPPPLRAGSAVLAVLEEDGEWHGATVEKVVPAPSGEGPPVVVVRFNEWAKVQETKRTQVVALTEVADDEGATERDGCCELCGRQMKLTFHHLVPKETHGRYPGKVKA